MRALIVLMSVSLSVLLTACSNPRQEVTVQLGNDVLLPAHQQWRDSNAALVDAVEAYCAAPQASVDDLETAFYQAQSRWSHLQPLMVGPLSEGNRSWQVQFWPDKRNMVVRQTESLLDETDSLTGEQLEKASVVVQGLTAFEYVLFDQSVALAENHDRYCPLLTGIARHQLALSESVLTLWNEPGGMLAQLRDFPNERYATADEGLAAILRTQITGVDVLKKKLGTPMGRLNQGVAQPYQAEAWRSRQSIENLQASLQGAQAVWERVRSLVSDAALVKDIDQAYADVANQLAALPAPLMELVQAPQHSETLTTLYAALDNLENRQQAELARNLNIQIGFNANDGD